MQESGDERTVIGEQDETFAVEVEPSDGNAARSVGGQQVDDRAATAVVAGSGEHTSGFVQGVVAQGLGFWQRPSVQRDVMGLRIDSERQICCHLAVHCDSSCAHEGFSSPPGRDSTAGNGD